MKQWLKRVCDIRDDELRLVQAFFLFFTGIGMFYTVGATVGDTLFLANLPKDEVPTMLPWFYAGVAAGSFFAALLYDAVQHRISRLAAIVGTEIALALTVLVFRLALGLEAPWLYLALSIWLEVAALLSISLFFSFAGDYFAARDARRLYGFIAGGMALGTVVAGNAISIAVVFIGTRDLLYVCFGLLLVNALIAWRIHCFATPVPVEVESGAGAADKVPLRAIFERPYVRMVAVMIALAIVVAVVVDYQMKWIASTKNEEELAQFFGTFYGLVGVAQILFQFLIVPRLLKRLGIINCLMILPIAIGLASGLLLLGSTVAYAGLGLLAFSATANFLRITLSETLDLPSRELLFLPLPTRLRTRAQPFVDGALAATARGLGGMLLLLLFTAGVGVEKISFVVVACSGLAIAALLALRPRYRETLAATLRAKDMDACDLERTAQSPSVDGVIAGLLRSPDPAIVRFTIGLLKSRPAGTLGALQPLVEELSRSADPQVAVPALELFGAGRDPEHLPILHAALSRSEAPIREAAVLALSESLGAASYNEVSALLDAEDPALRRAAIVGLGRHCGEMGVERIRPLLAAAAANADPVARVEAARILLAIGRIGFTDVLRLLLRDAEEGVRVEAVQAVAGIGETALVPELLAALGDPALRAPAIRALRTLPPEAVGAVAERARRSSPSDRRLLFRVISRIGGRQAAAFLWEQVIDTHEDLAVRSTAASALSALQRRGGFQHPKWKGLAAVEKELFATLALVDEARSEVGVVDHFTAGVLGDHARIGLELLLSLYGLKHDPRQIDRILFNLFSDAPPMRSRAVELLDDVLPRRVASRVLALLHPVIDDKPPTGTGLTPKTRDRLLASSPYLRAVTAFHLSRSDAAPEIPLDENENDTACRLSVVELVKAAPLFFGVFADHLIEHTDILVFEERPAGTVLLRQGDPGDALYVVLAGEVSIRVDGVDLARLGAGEHFGEIALLDSEPRSATVTAETDVRLVRIGASDLGFLVAAQPAIAKALLRTLDARIRRTQESRAESGQRDSAAPRLSHISFMGAPDLMRLVPFISFLQQVDLFKDLPIQSLTRLAGLVQEMSCYEGDEIFRQGDPGDALYLVCEGKIDIIVDGRKVAVLGKNACLGEMALIGDSARSATARVMEDATLLRLWAEDFNQLLVTEPEVPAALLKALAARLRHMSRRGTAA